MKKTSKALILLLSIAFLFTSCDGSFSDVLSKMMDPFSKNNLYLNSGLVKPNMKDAEALNNIVTNTESSKPLTDKGDGTLDLENSGSNIIKNINSALSAVIEGEFSIKPTENGNTDLDTIATILTTGGGILEATDQSTLSSTVNSALNSPTQTEQFKKNMSESAPADSVTATQNTYKVGAAVINIVKEQFKDSGSDNPIVNALSDLSEQISAKAESNTTITKGDVLQAQIITNLINTSAVVVTKDKNDLNLNDREVKDLVDGAILLINTSKTISGGLDLTGIDFGSLIPSGSSTTEETPASYSAARSISSESDWNDISIKETMGDIKIEAGYINLLDFGVAGAADKFVQVSTITTDYDVNFRNTDLNNGIVLSGFVDGNYSSDKIKQEDIENRKKALSMMKSMYNTLFTKGDGVFERKQLENRNQNFAYMLSGYKLLYSVAENNDAIKQYINDSNKAEISSVLDCAMGLIAGELPNFSKAIFDGDSSKYIDIIDAMYYNSKNLFGSGDIVVNSTDKDSCSKLSIGEDEIVDLYKEDLGSIDVVIKEKNGDGVYTGLMWNNEAGEVPVSLMKEIFDEETQSRIIGHTSFLDSMIVQLDLDDLVYKDLSYTDSDGTPHNDIANLTALVRLAFDDLTKKTDDAVAGIN